MADGDGGLQRLLDERDLGELIHRYAMGLDTRDWVLWRSIFTDQIDVDFSDWQPEPPPRRVAADAWVRSAQRLFAGFEATQHFIAPPSCVIAGDRATMTAHMRAEHWLTTGPREPSESSSERAMPLGGDRYTMFGTYTDRCVRTPDGWRISAVTLSLVRQEGNRDVMRLAARRGADAVGDRAR